MSLKSLGIPLKSLVDPMEEANLKRIEEDYLNAWYVKNRALKTGDYAVYLSITPRRVPKNQSK